MQHTKAAMQRASRNRSIMLEWKRGRTNKENAQIHGVSVATIKNVIRALRQPERAQQAEIEALVLKTMAREVARRELYREGFEHGRAAAVDDLARQGRLSNVNPAPVDPPQEPAKGPSWQDHQRRWYYLRQG